MSLKYLVCYILCFLGLIFVGVAKIVSIVNNRKKSQCTVQTQGTIIENKLVRKTSRNAAGTYSQHKSYYSVVRYYFNNQPYTSMSNVGTSKPLNEEGAIVTVYFNPKEPEKYYILEEQNTVKRLKIIFTAIGIVMLILGLTIAVFIYFRM